MYLLCARRLEPKETIRCGKLIRSSLIPLLFYIFALGVGLGNKDGYARDFHDYVLYLAAVFLNTQLINPQLVGSLIPKL